MNDRTTSMVDNTDRVVCLYMDADYNGNFTWMNPHTAVSDIGSRYNDMVSSWHFC
jgi:hypothetical protein